jgi:arabinofuranosyltransferase
MHIKNKQEYKNKFYIIIMFLFFIYIYELIKTAWIADDAAITLRTVLHFINGYGPNFNIDERVQGYTHPLWFLMISILSFISNNVFSSTFLLSISLSIIVMISLLFFNKNYKSIILGVIVLILSKSYIEFTVSGLENPLNHIFIVIIAYLSIKIDQTHDIKLLRYYTVMYGLSYLSRPDLIIIMLPSSIYIFYKLYKHDKITITSILKYLLMFATPILMWSTFSLYYYGFLFPNTKYAKLSTGINEIDLIKQGVFYLIDCIIYEPIAIIVPLITAIFIFINKQKIQINHLFIVNILTYILYIVYIGGDFMSGRFFSSIIVLTSIIIINTNWVKKYYLILIFMTLLCSMFELKYTLGIPEDTYVMNHHGIANERTYYFKQSGLIYNFANLNPIIYDKNLSITDYKIICGGLGYTSIYYGPNFHFIDFCGLTDPLLSKMKIKDIHTWRIGHFERDIPDFYPQSILMNQNNLNNLELKIFYDKIRLLTRGDLNNYNRFKTILELNFNIKY